MVASILVFQFSVENRDLGCLSLAYNSATSPLVVRDVNLPNCSVQKPVFTFELNTF
jgi:hypothetical protein